jgi:arabinose-5-phosphate isomerase
MVNGRLASRVFLGRPRVAQERANCARRCYRGAAMTEISRATTPLSSALRTLRVEREGIAALETALSGAGALGKAFAEAVALIAAASGRVIVTGMGKSGHVARKIASTLASTGQPASFVHPGEASHGDLGMIVSGDTILALSWSGETAELADLIVFSRRYKINLVALTSRCDSALGREADVCLQLPVTEEACPNGLAPTTSTTMQMALGDALAIALLEARGFTAHDFKTLHPGGKLGARLKYARDIMHKGKDMPSVTAGAAMGEAVYQMSSKGVGCVGIVDAEGRLAGIITDGDLRRHMRADLMAAKVEDVMTRHPRTIPPDMLAAEALEILETRKISALFVVGGDGRPQGVVHFHDLLRLGAV